MTNCPHCAKLVDPNLDNCPYCGGFLRQPAAEAPQKQERKSSQTCPSCRAFVQPGDIICVACGTNLLTGQRVAEEAPVASQGPAINWRAVAGIVIVLLLIVIVGGMFFMLTRDPVAQAIKLAAQGKNAEATLKLEDYVVDHSADARGLFELGKLYWKDQRFDEAADMFKEAVIADNTNVDAALLAVASSAASFGARDYGDEANLLEGVAEQSDRDYRAWYRLAMARGAQGDLNGQAEALARVNSLRVGDPAALRAEGVVQALQGDVQRADITLQSVASNDGDTLAAVGLVAHLNGDAITAERRLRQALDSNTSISDLVQLQLALIDISEGRYDDAYRLLNRVLNAQPDHQAAQFFHAVCLGSLQLNAEALIAFERLSAEGGEYAARAALEVANLRLSMVEVNLARQSADRAEGLGANGPALNTVRGRIAAMDGDLITAQDRFKRALRSNPNFAPAHLETGLVYIQRGMFTEAVNALTKYLELVGQSSSSPKISQIETLVQQLKSTMGTQ
jgi:tetratricopeptide (TPR) repeat protein/RNA polymerase subunit RPABC4/transcription elongation factor Spt4